MSQDVLITVRGYVTAEPRFWQRTPTSGPGASIRVGVTPRKLNKETGEWQDGEPSYYTVKCWRKLAENVHGCLRKGDMVLVRGKVSTRSWIDDQQRVRTEWQIEADSVGHDLAYGWSHFNRGAHTPPGVLADLERGEAIRQGMAPDLDLPPDPDLPDDPEFSDDGDEALAAADGTAPDSAAELAGDAGQPADATAPF